MPDQIVRKLSPEERELERKRAELDALQSELAQHELDLATLQASLDRFEQQYLRVVGTRLAQLDELDARIGQVLSLLNPKDPNVINQAAQARAQADQSARACGAVSQEPAPEPFRPEDNLKALYRKLAKAIHPDLATDPADREQRTRLMAEINAAYCQGDENQLRNIMNEWEHRPESIVGDSIGAQLVRLIRQIAQVLDRIATVKTELAELRISDIFLLFEKAMEVECAGGDLLVAMAEELEAQIGCKRTHLDALLDEFSAKMRTT